MIHTTPINSIINSVLPSQNLRRCNNCGKWKDGDVFKKGRNICKMCDAARAREYRVRNREEELARKRKYRVNNSKKLAAKHKKYKADLKANAYDVLGGAFCVRCGYTGVALQIDHVNGDGFLERKKIKGVAGLYKKIIVTGGAGYQVLCANCNWEKREEDEERRKALINDLAIK